MILRHIFVRLAPLAGLLAALAHMAMHALNLPHPGW